MWIRTRIRTRTRRMREIFLTANPDTLASWFAWLRTRTRKKSRAFASLIFYFCLFYNQTAFWRDFNHFGYCTSRQDHLSVWLSTDSKASFRGIVDARPMRIPCVNLMSTFHFLFKKQILRIGPNTKESRAFIQVTSSLKMSWILPRSDELICYKRM